MFSYKFLFGRIIRICLKPRLGGSQLVRLLAKAYSAGSKVTVVDTFTNLGAMLDMVGLDLERQGQGQLATCSGGFKEGSLSIKLNGSGIPDVASKDLPGIKGAEVEEKVIAGFVADEHTLYTGITEYGQIVQVCLSAVLSTESTFHVLTQVTPGSVRLVCPSLKESLSPTHLSCLLLVVQYFSRWRLR